MSLSIGCHQLSFSSDKTENLNEVLRVIEDSDAYLDVFPEYTMGVPQDGLTKDYVQRNAESLDGEFVTKILEKTSQKQTSTVFTAFISDGKSVYNAAILAEKGKIKEVYRKIHLFDAFGYRESDLFSPGRALAIVELKSLRIGLAVCFDLRFPELFRQMAYREVDLFIVPSAWYKGENKLEQWRILVKARAHENASYLIAVDQTHPFFVGHSMAVSPLAYTIHEVQEEETSFFIRLDRKEIEKAKRLMPIIRLSKPKLYKDFNMDRQKGALNMRALKI